MTDFLGTTQGIMTLGALIGAGSFAIGAASPSLGRWAKAIFQLGRPMGNARHLAMLTVLAFDDFVGACFAAAHDTPEFNPMDQGEFAFHVPDPQLALPKDADWSLLGADFGEEIMWFSNRVTNLENALDSLDLSAHAYGGFFERRQEGYARLGASGMDLIARMLAEYDLSMPEKPDYYRQDEGFAAILRKVEVTNTKAIVPGAPAQGGVSNVTHLFARRRDEAE